jgi:hypothetical protein
VSERRVDWYEFTNFSDVFTASIIRAIIGSVISLITEAARTSETSVNSYQSTRRYNPEDSLLGTHLCDLKTYYEKYLN